MAGYHFCKKTEHALDRFYTFRDVVRALVPSLIAEDEPQYWLRVAIEAISTKGLKTAMDELVKRGYGIMLGFFSVKAYSFSTPIREYCERKGYEHFASIFVTCFPHNLVRYCISRKKDVPRTWEACFDVPRHSNDIGVAFAKKVIIDEEKKFEEMLVVHPNIIFMLDNVRTIQQKNKLGYCFYSSNSSYSSDIEAMAEEEEDEEEGIRNPRVCSETFSLVLPGTGR
jgi:hypothetical protein